MTWMYSRSMFFYLPRINVSDVGVSVKLKIYNSSPRSFLENKSAQWPQHTVSITEHKVIICTAYKNYNQVA